MGKAIRFVHTSLLGFYFLTTRPLTSSARLELSDETEKRTALTLHKGAGLAVIATKAYELSSALLQTLHFEFASSLLCDVLQLFFIEVFCLKIAKPLVIEITYLLEFRYF